MCNIHVEDEGKAVHACDIAGQHQTIYLAMAYHRIQCLLCRGYDGTLAIGILPVALFASGHTYFVQRLHERMGLEVYCVHATYQFSGTDGKRHRMRERMLWVVVSEMP